VVDTHEKLPWRLLFLFMCLLAAGDLILASISLWSGKSFPNPAKSLHAITGVPRHISKFASSVTDIKSFVTPSHDDKLVTITPLEAAPVAKAIPAVTPTNPVQVAVPASTAAVSSAPPSPKLPVTNLYAWGNCTWWASARRAQINDPIPNSWGNAATWAYRAAQDGYIVDHTPHAGAIMQLSNTAGGLGHVAFVESVGADGTWNISEMNVIGLNVVDHVARSLSEASNYNFIHDRM
jgi:surface antigen